MHKQKNTRLALLNIARYEAMRGYEASTYSSATALASASLGSTRSAS